MNTTIVARLVWKEYRQTRALFLALAAFTLLAVLLSLLAVALWHPAAVSVDLTPAFACLALYAMGCAAMGFALETETGTRELLRQCPLRTRELLAGKFGFAAASTVILAAVLAAAIWLLDAALSPQGGFGREVAGRVAAIWGVMAVEFYAWTMLCALALRNTVLAACWGGGLAVAVSYLFVSILPLPGLPLAYDVRLIHFAPWRLAVALVVLAIDMVLAARWLPPEAAAPVSCTLARAMRRWLPRRKPAGSPLQQPATVELSVAADQSEGADDACSPHAAEYGPQAGLAWVGRWAGRRETPRARLLWLALCQSRHQLLSALALAAVNLVLAAVVVLAGWWLAEHMHESPPQWITGLFLVEAVLAALLGATCFRCEGPRHQAHFLAERPVRPAAVWCTRLLPSLAGVLLLALTYNIAATAVFGGLTEFHWVGPVILLGLFASAQFSAMGTQSALAGAFAGLVLLVLAGFWLVLAAGPSGWEPPPFVSLALWSLPLFVAMLVDTRLGTADWLNQRKRVLPLRVFGSVLFWVAILVFVGVRFERVLSVPPPQSGEFASLADRALALAGHARLARPSSLNEGLETYEMYCRAVRHYVPQPAARFFQEQTAAAADEPLQGDTEAQVEAQVERRRRWLDENDESLALLLEAARRSTYHDAPFRQMVEMAELRSPGRSLPQFSAPAAPPWEWDLPDSARIGMPWSPYADRLSELLLGKAQQLQYEGDLESAWEHLFAATVLAYRAEDDPTSSLNPLFSRLGWRAVYERILHWAVAPGQNSRLVAKAIDDLRAARGQRPCCADRVAKRYYFLTQVIEGNPLATAWQRIAAREQTAILDWERLTLLLPGETTYLKRRLAQWATHDWVAARRLDGAELGMPTGPLPPPWEAFDLLIRRETTPYAAVLRVMEPPGLHAPDEMLYYRLTLIELALLAYQLDHQGDLPGSLDALVVEGYLHRVPGTPGTEQPFRCLPEGIKHVPPDVKAQLGTSHSLDLGGPWGWADEGLADRQSSGAASRPLLVSYPVRIRTRCRGEDEIGWYRRDWLIDAGGSWRPLRQSDWLADAIPPWPVLRPTVAQPVENEAHD